MTSRRKICSLSVAIFCYYSRKKKKSGGFIEIGEQELERIKKSVISASHKNCLKFERLRETHFRFVFSLPVIPREEKTFKCSSKK